MTDFSEDEGLAAEYALGTLDRAEREAAAKRRDVDRGFDALVRDWELRLAPLSLTVPDVAPPPAVFTRVLAGISQAAPPTRSADVLVMRRQLRFWRGAAAIVSALAAMLAIWVVGREVADSGANQTYVAVLQQGNGAPTFLVSLDVANHRMSVRPVGTTAPAGKSYELWMIGDHAQPKSMGVMDTDAPMRPAMPDLDKSAMTGATYAVTLEPRGGSPTGQPTSAPIFVGKMVNTAL